MFKPRSAFAFVLAAGLPAGLAAGPAAATPRACPPAGFVVERTIGPPVKYLGSVPGIPDLCRMDQGDGPGRYYMGVWRAAWPGSGDAYPALRQIIDGHPGSSASFVTHKGPGLNWDETVTNDGPETVVIAGRPYRTLRISHERTGIEGNYYHSIISQWRVIATGVTVKQMEHQIAGQSYGPQATWQATRIIPPGR